MDYVSCMWVYMLFVCGIEIDWNIKTRSCSNQALKSAQPSLLSSRCWPWGVFSSWLASCDLRAACSSYLAIVGTVVIYKGITGLIHYTYKMMPLQWNFCINSWGLMTHLHISELGLHWSRQWLAACLVPRRYLYQGRHFSSVSIEQFSVLIWITKTFFHTDALGKELPTRWFY